MTPNVIVVSTVETEKPKVFKSRWGYHCCSYELSMLIRKVYKAYWSAVYKHSSWRRWVRKEPQNQVRREIIRNSEGQKIGVNVLGPRAEPETCKVFCKTKKVKKKLGDGPYNYIMVDRLDDLGILEARRCTHPVATPEEVKPLGITEQQIRNLAVALGIE